TPPERPLLRSPERGLRLGLIPSTGASYSELNTNLGLTHGVGAVFCSISVTQAAQGGSGECAAMRRWERRAGTTQVGRQLTQTGLSRCCVRCAQPRQDGVDVAGVGVVTGRSEEHTSELQSRENLVCRL